MYAFTYSFSIALFLIVVFIILARKNLSALLKDKSTLPLAQRSYSLSSTITFYWTMIVILSLCYLGIATNSIPSLNDGMLILIGIAAATTTAGKMIDADQSANPAITRVQDVTPSDGFLRDILSDSNGISVSRLQTVMFNLIYGCVFVSIVLSQHLLYDFPAQTLSLLGISSGAYALLKIPENTPATVIPAQPLQPVLPQQPNAGQQQNPPQ